MSGFQGDDEEKEIWNIPLKQQVFWCFFSDPIADRRIGMTPDFSTQILACSHLICRIMNFENPFEPVGRVEKKATKSTKSINFFYLDSNASKVSVVGDFNAWDNEANRMQRRIDGSWQATIELPNGHHRYMLNVDGNLVEDPKAHGIVRNEQGARVCMIAVSGF